MGHPAACVLAVLGIVFAVRAHPPHYDDGRSLSSWSGWAPGSGMMMFASSSNDDDDPWAVQPPPVWRMGEDGTPRPLDHPQPPKKKPQGKRKHHRDEDDDEDQSEERGGGSRANASFNAWFPILLNGYGGEEGASARGARPPSSQRPAEGDGVAAIANSVNHGRSGTANSHAVVFSGEPEAFFRRRPADYSKHSGYRQDPGYYR